MKFIVCDRGHYHDSDRHSDCPHCKDDELYGLTGKLSASEKDCIYNLSQKYHRKFYVNEYGVVCDSIEDSIEFQTLKAQIVERVKKELIEEGEDPELFGMWSCIENRSLHILKSEYNIDCPTHYEMNPDIILD